MSDFFDTGPELAARPPMTEEEEAQMIRDIVQAVGDAFAEPTNEPAGGKDGSE